jgi:Methylase involved in ubiquinone/menaquinone biosynthesis
MTEGAIIQLPQWLRSPVGQVLLEWEQRHLDQAVADLFGFHALQLGLPQLDALQANRMPHRWLAVESAADEDLAPRAPAGEADAANERPADGAAPRVHVVPPPTLRCHFDALPFAAATLDLVILPHALELARDPHLALREVERVLVPEGRAIIVGFNPASMWGLRQRLGRLRRRLAPRSSSELFLPHAGEFVGYRRLRDWLRLLSFEVEGGRFGGYRPPLTSEAWLARYAWMDRTGDRWWPVLGAVYMLVAVKRVRGMRLIGLARRDMPSRRPRQRWSPTSTHTTKRTDQNPSNEAAT